MTATLILDTYDATIATIRANHAPALHALLAERIDAAAALAAIDDRIAALNVAERLDIDAARGELFDRLYVKLDEAGDPVPRPGKPRGSTRAPTATERLDPPGGTIEDVPPEVQTTLPGATEEAPADPPAPPGYHEFMDAMRDAPDDLAEQLTALGWAPDEWVPYRPTALVYAAKHGLGPSAVTRMDNGSMQVDATGEAVA